MVLMCSFCKTNKAEYVKVIETNLGAMIKLICHPCTLKFKEKNATLTQTQQN